MRKCIIVGNQKNESKFNEEHVFPDLGGEYRIFSVSKIKKLNFANEFEKP